VIITVFLTWCQHAATMLSWWTRNSIVVVRFIGQMPFLHPTNMPVDLDLGVHGLGLLAGGFSLMFLCPLFPEVVAISALCVYMLRWFSEAWKHLLQSKQRWTPLLFQLASWKTLRLSVRNSRPQKVFVTNTFLTYGRRCTCLWFLQVVKVIRNVARFVLVVTRNFFQIYALYFMQALYTMHWCLSICLSCSCFNSGTEDNKSSNLGHRSTWKL